MLNPSNAKATFVQSTQMQKDFENYLIVSKLSHVGIQ